MHKNKDLKRVAGIRFNATRFASMSRCFAGGGCSLKQLLARSGKLSLNYRGKVEQFVLKDRLFEAG